MAFQNVNKTSELAVAIFCLPVSELALQLRCFSHFQVRDGWRFQPETIPRARRLCPHFCFAYESREHEHRVCTLYPAVIDIGLNSQQKSPLSSGLRDTS